MNITILDDYFDTLRACPVSASWTATRSPYGTTTQDTDALAERLRDTDALVLIRAHPDPGAVDRPAAAPEADQPAQRLSAYRHRRLYHAWRDRVLEPARRHAVPCRRRADLGLALAAMRQIPQQMKALQAGDWQIGVGRTLRGRTLGIYGYGRIGAEVARYGAAFGMKVLVWAREASRQRARDEGWDTAPDKAAFFEACDVLSLHMRLVKDTRGIVTADDLARMKPGALLVNTSRAGLIAPGALEQALRAGRPGMAAVDVYEEEPLRDTRHPLLNLPNVICTPHIGYVTEDEYETQFSDVFDQIVSYAAGQPIHVVNPEVLATSRRGA